MPASATDTAKSKVKIPISSAEKIVSALLPQAVQFV